MAFSQVAVTGKVLLSNQTAASGASVVFTLNTPISDGTQIVAPEALTARCAADGSFSITLNANDDGSTSPTGTYYAVAATLGSQSLFSFNVVVPAASAGTGVNLFTLATVPNPNVVSPYVSRLVAGTGVTLSPAGGTGAVTVTSSASGAQGHPVVASAQLHSSSLWQPTQGVPEVEQPDTLILFDARDERDALSQGMYFSADWANYYTNIDVAQLAPGLGGRSAIAATTGAYDQLRVPLDGLFPRDQFTVVLDLTVNGADFTARPSQEGSFFMANTAITNSAESFEIYRGSTNLIKAEWSNGQNGGSQLVATLTVPVGYIPAGVPVKIAATWDGTYIKLWLFGASGQNLSVTSSALSGGNTLTSQPMASGIKGSNYRGGLFINRPNRLSPPNGPYTVGFHVMRYARPMGGFATPAGPAVTVTPSSTLPSAKPLSSLAGVFYQYAGWRDLVADGASGGGGTTPTSIRAKVLAAAGADGVTTSRPALTWDKITITGTNPYTYDWTNWQEPLDALVAAGVTNLLPCLTYCPTPLFQGAGNQRFNPPSSNANMAQIVSDATTWLVGRYGAAIKAVSVWNEPDTTGWWTGTTSQFTAMWGAIQAKLATTNPSVPFGGPDTFWVSGATGFTQAVITYAGANSRPLPILYHHDYSGDPYQLRENLRQQQAAATAAGFGTIPVAITEWNTDNSIYAERQGNVTSLSDADEYIYTQAHPAYAFAALAEMDASGLVSYGAISNLGMIDYPGGTAVFGLGAGLFDNQEPPRPLPIYGVFQALWKATGTRVSAVSSHKHLVRAVASINNGVITVVYGALRYYRPKETIDLSLTVNNLPAKFTWKLYSVGDTSEGRLQLRRSGDQTTFPLGVKLGVQEVQCLQVTPS